MAASTVSCLAVNSARKSAGLKVAARAVSWDASLVEKTAAWKVVDSVAVRAETMAFVPAVETVEKWAIPREGSKD